MIRTGFSHRRLVVLLVVALFSHALPAKTIYVKIDRIQQQPLPIALIPTIGSGPEGTTEEVDVHLRRLLDFTGYFRFLDQRAFIEPGTGPSMEASGFNFDNWLSIDALAIVKSSISVKGGNLQLTGALFDPLRRERLVLFSKEVPFAELSKVVEEFADQIILALSGEAGVFSTRIAYVRVARKGKREFRELKSVSPFSRDVKVHHRVENSVLLSPEWHPSGDRIYFVQESGNSYQIFELTVATESVRQLTRIDGIVTNLALNPAGTALAISVTKGNDTEIRLFTLETLTSSPVVRSVGLNIAPTFSPDGRYLAYSSGRSGGLHLWRQGLSPKTPPERITFRGDLNDHAAWSPRDGKLLFSGMDRDGQFDIFDVRTADKKISRLTYDSRNNESPSFSPDGRHIAFSSNRGGNYSLWIMRADGTGQRELVREEGANVINPAWGPRLR